MARVKHSTRPRRGLHVSWPNNIAIAQHREPSTQRSSNGARPSSHQRDRYHSHTSRYRPQAPTHAFRGHSSASRAPNQDYHRPAPPQNHSTTEQTQAKAQAPQAEKPVEKDSFLTNLARYRTLYEARMRECRLWVRRSFQTEHRFSLSVYNELNAYFGKGKFGNHPDYDRLSVGARQAIDLSEHALGTDLEWGKGVASVWGDYESTWMAKFEKGMADGGDGLKGPGYVGEEDLESWVGDSERWEGEEDVEMKDGAVDGKE